MTAEPMAARAYKHILQQVRDRRLCPGDWLDRRRIADELNTSLMPVSDAIQRLITEGLFVAVPRRGTQLRVPTAEAVLGQLLVREALECQAARMYCGKVVANATAIHELVQKADNHGGDVTVMWNNDLKFHRALVQLADCSALLEHFDRVMNLTLFQYSALLTPYPLNNGDRHADLLEDLSHMRADAAEARIRKHIRTGKDSVYATRISSMIEKS